MELFSTEYHQIQSYCHCQSEKKANTHIKLWVISCGNFYLKLASDWQHNVYFLSQLICWRKITCTCTYWYTLYEGIKLGLFVIIIYVMTDSKKTYENFPNYWKVYQIKCTMEAQDWVRKRSCYEYNKLKKWHKLLPVYRQLWCWERIIFCIRQELTKYHSYQRILK